jgi:hypothetical protein
MFRWLSRFQTPRKPESTLQRGLFWEFPTSRVCIGFSPHEAARPLGIIAGKRSNGHLDVGPLPTAGSTPDFATVDGRAPMEAAQTRTA